MFYFNKLLFDQTKEPVLTFRTAKKDLDSKIQRAFGSLFAKSVIYDQIEYFEQSNLNYPFIKRKSNIPQ